MISDHTDLLNGAVIISSLEVIYAHDHFIAQKDELIGELSFIRRDSTASTAET